MNAKTIFEIIELMLSVAKAETSGKIHENTVLADSIFQIINKVVDAGRTQTAQPSNQ